MDAETEYYTICANRYLHPLKAGEYGEVHHILPRSLGGMDISQNLVRLTPEEHYRCHELLPFIYTEGKAHRAMVNAWWLLAHDKRRKVAISQERYGVLKREHARMMSERMTGNHINAGTPKSEEHKRKLSEALKGRSVAGHPQSEETKRKISEACKGKVPWNKGVPCSEEQKRKQSLKMTGRHYSEDRNQRVSEGLKRRYSTGERVAWNKGRHLSEETRRKKSEAMKRYWVQCKGNLGVA